MHLSNRVVILRVLYSNSPQRAIGLSWGYDSECQESNGGGIFIWVYDYISHRYGGAIVGDRMGGVYYLSCRG